MTDKPNGKPARRPRRSREDIPAATDEHIAAGVEFLDGLLDRLDLDLDVNGSIDGKRARFELDGADKDNLAGGLGQGGGAVPLAMETLVSMSLGRCEGGRPSVALDLAGVERPQREERPRREDRPRRDDRPRREGRPAGDRPRSSGDREGRGRDSRSRDRGDRRPERSREPKRSAKEKVAREAQLGSVSEFLGGRIAELGVPIVIMGMGSFDRRVIHQNLGEGGMSTESEGFGSFRRLVVFNK